MRRLKDAKWPGVFMRYPYHIARWRPLSTQVHERLPLIGMRRKCPELR
ncbi:hypothetical protein DF3PB_10056 [uncultured Defluviicoccus sp.]|uniref:Uncharacterized protein n=1 Tax=metagenome TaxID=256318 RepID=A0A380T7F3_9ZZZZ|nr:hypothetical protein DF3PB_10056 [uncultured Defluviicoccus sp.]